ncbi:hypothetical protein ACTPEF_25295, partial [Clostridioides difficile]
MARNRTNSVIYGGSNTVISREALEEVDGVMRRYVQMETVTNNQSGVEIQLSLFEAIKDLLLINPIFLLGI